MEDRIEGTPLIGITDIFFDDLATRRGKQILSRPARWLSDCVELSLCQLTQLAHCLVVTQRHQLVLWRAIANL